MRVVIIKPFGVDTASGRVSYAPDQEVANGQRNWIDKGLAREVPEPKPEPKPETPKSAD